MTVYQGYEIKGSKSCGFGIYDPMGKRVCSASTKELAIYWIDKKCKENKIT